MKKVLLTGATGMIGKKIVEKLLDLDYHINYLTTSEHKLQEVFMGANAYYWNPYQGDFPMQAIQGVEVIIHLAGSNIAGSWSAKGKENLVRSRLVPSQEIYRVLSSTSHQVKQIICASAVGIYSNVQELQSEEKYIQAPDFLGGLVELWEQENMKFEQLGIGVALIRTGLVLDQYLGVLPQLAKPLKFHLATLFGSGQQGYSWIHHKDLVAIFLFVLQQQKSGCYNAVGPNAVSNRVFMQELAQLKSPSAIQIRVPQWILKCGLGEKSMLLTQGQYVSCQKIIDEGFVFSYPTLALALKEIYP